MSRFDVVIIGGGTNGLTCACLLARAGKKVAIYEKNKILGGLSAPREFASGFTAPGIHNDSHFVSRKITEELNLEKFGLEFHEQDPGALFSDSRGEGLHIAPNPDHCQSPLSSADHSAYREYRQFIRKARGVFRKILDNPPPDLLTFQWKSAIGFAQTAISLRSMGSRDMTTLLRSAPMCVADYLNGQFDSVLLKTGLAVRAVSGTFTGPWSPGNTTNLLVWECLNGPPAIGGPQSVAKALEGLAKECGVEVHCNTPVAQIIVDNQRATGVSLENGETVMADKIVSACDFKYTFKNLVSPKVTGSTFSQRVSEFRTRGTSSKIHLAIKGPIRWKNQLAKDPEYVRMGGDSLDDIEKSFDFIKYGKMSERPVLEAFVPTVSAPHLAPEGHHILSLLVHFTPYDLKEGWNKTSRQQVYANALRTLKKHCEGIETQVVAHEVLTPKDIEQEYNVAGGQLFHGEHALDQLLTRPTPETMNYHTPIENLFLASGSGHPGGGLQLRVGELCAKALLK